MKVKLVVNAQYQIAYIYECHNIGKSGIQTHTPFPELELESNTLNHSATLTHGY